MQSAVPPLSAAQKKEVEEAFDLFDADRTGFIDYHELKVCVTIKVEMIFYACSSSLQPSSVLAMPTVYETCASADGVEGIRISRAQARCATNCTGCWCQWYGPNKQETICEHQYVGVCFHVSSSHLRRAEMLHFFLTCNTFDGDFVCVHYAVTREFGSRDPVDEIREVNKITSSLVCRRLLLWRMSMLRIVLMCEVSRAFNRVSTIFTYMPGFPVLWYGQHRENKS